MSDDVLEQLRSANPVPGRMPNLPIEPVLRRLDTEPDQPAAHARARRRGPRLRRALPLALVVAVVVAVAAVAVLTIHAGKNPTLNRSAQPGTQTLTLVYDVLPTPEHPTVTAALMRQTVRVLRFRARMLGGSQARVSADGTREVTVKLWGVRLVSVAERAIGSDAQLEFYDWESSVLLPSGKEVASQLALNNPHAILISQGQRNSGGPGLPGTGGISFYRAVTLASKQHPDQRIAGLSRLGPEYYLFGAPGSAACAAAVKAARSTPVPGQHCYLAGPDARIAALRSDPARPASVAASAGQALEVPQGWVVLQAQTPDSPDTIKPTSPDAQYFVLRDHPGLSGNQITDPRATTQNGDPVLQFGFTRNGGVAFQQLTSTIAHRGKTISTSDNQLYQHFAVAFDGQLLSVPQINYQQYPDGVVSLSGASIQTGSTRAETRQLATLLRDEQLPVKLRPVHAQR